MVLYQRGDERCDRPSTVELKIVNVMCWKSSVWCWVDESQQNMNSKSTIGGNSGGKKNVKSMHFFRHSITPT
jgi:hypothetical protein